MKVVNNSKALQGVNTVKGVVYLRPGEMKDVEFTEEGLKQAKRQSFLSVRGEKEARNAASKGTVETKTAEQVLAMADDEDVPFMSFKAAATKLLGNETPSEKDEIVLALMEAATKPE
jgi:hypothetical protein